MAEVYIDGVLHTPGTGSNIGVAINTHNRPDVLAQSLIHHHQHLPAGAKLVVVDDASDTPVQADYRFDTNVGVARAKNKALELLAADPTIQHFFLWDEDAWPIVDDWHVPYVESPSNHLMYQFKDLAKGPKLNDMDVVFEDDQHIAYTGARGVMLYVTRKVLDTVGGFDPAFGKCLYEHLSWSDRIHNAGLSLYRYGDVQGSSKLIHSMDEYCEVARSVPNAERLALVEVNKQLWLDSRDSRQYIEYRDLEDVILTCYFTGVTDSQRASKWPVDYSQLDILLGSVEGKRVVIFHNQENPPERLNVEWVYTPVNIDVYWQCWYSFHKWLAANPVRYVWCVDATDVELLDPSGFASLEPDLLYCGWEPKILGTEWMRDKHTSHLFTGFFAGNQSNILLNSGILGGDHATVLEFCQKMIQLHGDHAWLNFHNPGQVGFIGPDMGGFNYVAYQHFRQRIITGPAVATVFKAFDADNTEAAWRHK